MCHIELTLIVCVLRVAFSQLVIPVCFWHRSPEVGCLCLDIGNQGTVYVSRKMGRTLKENRSNLDVPGTAGLLMLG